MDCPRCHSSRFIKDGIDDIVIGAHVGIGVEMDDICAKRRLPQPTISEASLECTDEGPHIPSAGSIPP